MLALHRAPHQRSSVKDLAHSLDLDGGDVRAMVSELAAAGLVDQVKDEVALAPKTVEDRTSVTELVAVSGADRIAIVMAIAESSMNRLRNLAGRAFADAFVIRKKPGGDDDR
ncbi:MAG: hypothetical protein H0X17_00085 [Deltaproteobacteria bacterium]|nr:hypothetical protein [Deltaproteobacteria bacterium]